MNTLINYYIRVQNVLRSPKGQGMVEYGLILALVSVVVIATLTSIGNQLLVKFGNVLTGLGGTAAE